MEWCRMYALKIVACFAMVLHWCVNPALSGRTWQVPDSPASQRHPKLEALIRSLDSYSFKPTIEPRMHRTKNSSQSQEALKVDQGSSEPRSRLTFQEEPNAKELIQNPNSVKSYQDFYRAMYGTREGIEHIRRNFGPTGLEQVQARFPQIPKALNDVRKANDHFLKIRTRARCRSPVPQVIRVKDYYPDPSREYLPRCTLLHRCSDSTGCCDNDAFHCVPSAVQEVVLHFYTLTVGKNGLGYRGDDSIEKLWFENHTACHCQPINDLPRLQDGRDPLDGSDQTFKLNCAECPVPFTRRLYKDGRCGCDCFDRQKPCLRIKRGKVPLSQIERRCVEANECHIPDCEYGLYDPSTGYCPRRHDEAQRYPRRHHHHSPSQRWAFIERD